MTLRAPHLSRPRPRGRQVPQLIPNLLIATLAVAALPFVANEFTRPQPRAVQQPVQAGSPLTLIEDAGDKPFAKTDWPNPTIPRILQPGQAGRSTGLLAPVVAPPFAKTDWPNPTVPGIRRPGQAGRSIGLLAPVVAAPFAKTDWPNPTAPGIRQPGQAGRSTGLLAPVVAPPFAKTDWPNPTARAQVLPFQAGKSIALVAAVPDLAIRERLLAAVKTALEGIGGYQVRRNPTRAVEFEDLPAIDLYDGGHVHDARPGISVYQLIFTVELYVAGSAREAALSTALVAVDQALFADPTFGDLALDIDREDIGDQEDLREDGTPPVAALRVDYVIDFWTRPGLAAALGP